MSSLIRWNPTRTPMRLWNEFDRLFGDSFDWLPERWQQPGNWGMAIDVAETDNEYVVKASVPGVNPDDLNVTLENNVLTIRGEVKEDKEVNEGEYHLRERRYGSFNRSVTLPAAVNADNIDATYEQGVLTLHVPKAEEVRPKRINIKAENR